jgi:hypothetical protein
MPRASKGRPQKTREGVQKGDRVRAAFVRMFDAHPDRLDAMAEACWEKAAHGDMQAQSFIRDTMDGKPIQRSDISMAHQHKPGEQMTDEELAARIAELEARLAVLDQDEEAANDSENAGTAH